MNVEQKAPRFIYRMVCRDADGVELWQDTFENVVTTPGKNDNLDKYFSGAGYTASWFLGLKGVGVAVAADTLASHASWTEFTGYTGNRPPLTFTPAAAGSKESDDIIFNITGSGTVAGCISCTVASGTAGILYSAGDAVAAQPVISGNTLTVTLTVTVT